METVDFIRLLKRTDNNRQTVEILSPDTWGFEYKHRNSLAEALLRGESVTLDDKSVLKMVIDDIDKFRADYDGYRTFADPEYGWGSYAEAKSVIARLTEPDGTVSYWKLSMYYDSWDNGYTDEWTHSTVDPVEWKGD